jgi:hypothetical protein
MNIDSQSSVLSRFSCFLISANRIRNSNERAANGMRRNGSGNNHTPLLLLPFADAPFPALLFHEEPQRQRHGFGHRPFSQRVGPRGAIGDAKNFGGGDLAQAKRFENSAIVVLRHAVPNGYESPRHNRPFD